MRRMEQVRPGDPRLARRLAAAVEGEVRFDPFTRGRYSTDASIYQIEPIGVVIPRTAADVATAIEIAREEGVPVLPRGAGTSQCGQTVGRALVLDTSRHLNRVLETDVASETVTVEPGIVLDRLNKILKPSGFSFPIDVSPANRATIGGMTGNNSCGARSIQYGIMVHNVLAVDAILADGAQARFAETGGNLPGATDRYADLVRSMDDLYVEEADEIAARIPKVLRKVGGYNIETLGERPRNLAKLLVGSEGTLGFFTKIQLRMHRLPKHRVQAICHFAHFYDAMASTRYIVTLGPSAVELVDRTMIDLARKIPAFAPTIERAVKGEPEALLLVEFSGEDHAALLGKMAELDQMMGDLGYPDAIVPAVDPAFQAKLAEVRSAGLNIMMSMKGDGKPVSFIEDCAVPLDDLADYTQRLTDLFGRNGVEGTWYAHASVGCLHVRPVLNMKDGEDVAKMRRIAEEAFAIVREYKGAHSGEHGDGLVRSEFHEAMFGPRIVRAFERVKDTFDPDGLFNPGKIVRPQRMDDRSLMRYRPDYQALPLETALDWSEWGGFLNAVEMCNNNGTCRKSDPGVMCPSFRATEDEQDVTRGRANSLRLALSGQLGPNALTSDAMKATMDLCVGCKGCKRECPTGVDMARMKLEFLHHWQRRHGLTVRQRLVAYLPRYAHLARHFAAILNLRNRVPALAALGERALGLSRRRSLPAWRADAWRPMAAEGEGAEVVLLADTFNGSFEPENLRAARRVLLAAGYRVVEPPRNGRPLCCGRTFLAAGLIDEARVEARRLIAALAPFLARGAKIVGLEPSCLLTLRDEYAGMLGKEEATGLARSAMLFEEFLAAEQRTGRLNLALRPIGVGEAYLHGHCHQKAFGLVPDVATVLGLVPGLTVKTIEATCCGMAGAFGYEVEHFDVAMRIGELSVLPAVRAAPPEALIVADGTSCRHQIADGAARPALHVARVLERALA
ncbi:FAD-binding and (Fe-S)-binding domain-containing protein [Aliidongia dinghuensis]|nr:FAD-binding and (Fe-S)-binding domain-containing protein [Aliidongia dinghuensis]